MEDPVSVSVHWLALPTKLIEVKVCSIERQSNIIFNWEAM